MKTVLFCWESQLDPTAGGVERVTQRIMDGLSKRGFNCLFLRHDAGTDRFFFNGEDVKELGAFLIRRGVDTIVNQSGHSSRLTELLVNCQWQGRYIVCHHNEPQHLQKLFDSRRAFSEILSPNALLKTRIAWLSRLVAYPIWRAWSNRRIAKVQKINYSYCDVCVLLSKHFIPLFMQLIERNEVPKVTAIPNPLSFETKSEDVEGFVKRKEVLVVGRLDEQEKRISLALQAWALIQDWDRDEWELKVVGDGPDSAALRQQAVRLGLRRVRFLGRQDPLPHYKSAAILLMTSRVEGWGLTLTEAMQTGTVPVAFDSYLSLRDIIDDGKTGLIVRNGDVAAFAEAVMRLMSDSKQRRTIATDALAACQKYRLEAVLDQWVKVL